MADGPLDTLVLVARCRYVGETGSKLATHYFRVNVDSVLEGHLTDRELVFEADINSRGYRLFEFFPKKTQATVGVDSLFGIQSVPVSRVYTCSGAATIN